MLFQVHPQHVQQTDICGTGVLGVPPASLPNHSSEISCSSLALGDTVQVVLEGDFNCISSGKADLSLWASDTPPGKGSSTLLCLTSSHSWAQAPWLILHHALGLWLSPDQSHSTTLPSRTKDLLHL